MEIRQLKYFIEIQRTGSISLAAENLGLTQPALSQQIALLERELKVSLFERSRRGMALTEAGEIFAGKAAAILESCADLEAELRRGGNPVQVSFAVGETLAAHFVPQLLVNLRRKFPDTRFRVIESNLTEIRAALRDGSVDFALAPEPLSENTFTNRYLIEDEILPVVSADDPLSQRRVDWEKLRTREWILFHPGSAIRKISDGIFAETEKRFQPRISMELRSVAGAVQCLEAGLGVGFISDLSLTPGLAALRLPQLTRRRRFFLTHRRNAEKIAGIAGAILQFAGAVQKS
ncbi:MAG: LysR family transcriptional regulator [Turneriella sp.]